MRAQTAITWARTMACSISNTKSFTYPRYALLSIVNRTFNRNLQLNYASYNGKFVKTRAGYMFLGQMNDSVKKSLYLFGVYEPFETQLLKKITPKNGVVIDVGANIGYYTLYLSKLVGRGGKVYAFEPEPKNYRLLQKNLQLNDANNVVLSKKAVAEKSGKARLYLHDTAGGHSIAREFDSYIEIETVNLDDYLLDKRVSLVKMDVEGAEPLVIKGMLRLLNESKNMKIIMEFFPKAMQEAGYSFDDIATLLYNEGFSAYDIKEAKLYPTEEKLRAKYDNLLEQQKATDLIWQR